MAKRQCKANNKAGGPCGMPPLHPGRMVGDYAASGDYCYQHDEGIPEELQAGGAQPGGGRKKIPKPDEVSRRLVEEGAVALQRPYWLTLGFDVEIGDDGPYLVKLPEGGAKVSATHKGQVIVSGVEDLGAQMAASEALQNRVLGKPKQATEISGPEGGAIEVVNLQGLSDEALREIAAAVGVTDDAGPRRG